ncbi:MAG: SpoVA/SpoVAEb family sporulation membrane protein [Clostridia bacterium]|nr:SpoVA/SpoVAEb family sporulation membrane protein [Clostridia bacterium]
MLGVGTKIFTIAGPVILYGITAGAVYGVVYWISTLF